MSETETANDGGNEQKSLAEQPYGDLMNAARSAREQFEEVDVDTDAPKKDELVEEMESYGFTGSRQSGWTVMVADDEKEVELLKVQTPDSYGTSGGPTKPKDATVLYCLTRAETTDERVERISEALEDAGFELQEAGSGDKYSIVEPATEEDIEAYEAELEEWEAEQAAAEEAEDDEDEESDSEAESDDESGGEDESEGEDEAEQESADEASEAADDEDGDDDDDTVPEAAARKNLDGKTKDELYSMAVDDDIDGRSDKSKDELIDALIEVRIDEGKVTAE